MDRNRARLGPLAVTLAVALSVGATVRPESTARTVEVASAVACGENMLLNPSFDQPVVQSGWRATSETTVDGWATDPGTKIEMWASGFLGYPANSGANLIELNYRSNALVYQDVTTTPGTELTWRSHHRNRNVTDRVELLLGPPSGPLVQMMQTEAPLDSWMLVEGTYVVPPGQTVTRFGLKGVSGGGSGNLADDAFLAESCAPEPPPIAVGDDLFARADTGGLLDIGGNDSLTPGFSFSETAVVAPSLGTVQINPDGFASYVPNADATGFDTFSYEACGEDERGRVCEVGVVTIALDN